MFCRSGVALGVCRNRGDRPKECTGLADVELFCLRNQERGYGRLGRKKKTKCSAAITTASLWEHRQVHNIDTHALWGAACETATVHGCSGSCLCAASPSWICASPDERSEKRYAVLSVRLTRVWKENVSRLTRPPLAERTAPAVFSRSDRRALRRHFNHQLLLLPQKWLKRTGLFLPHMAWQANLHLKPGRFASPPSRAAVKNNDSGLSINISSAKKGNEAPVLLRLYCSKPPSDLSPTTFGLCVI